MRLEFSLFASKQVEGGVMVSTRLVSNFKPSQETHHNKPTLPDQYQIPQNNGVGCSQPVTGTIIMIQEPQNI
jgi:hypothetical protein